MAGSSVARHLLEEVTQGGRDEVRGFFGNEVSSGHRVSADVPADEWHWHGAAPGDFMTHLSITEAVPDAERPDADWGDHVTDDEYNGH